MSNTTDTAIISQQVLTSHHLKQVSGPILNEEKLPKMQAVQMQHLVAPLILFQQFRIVAMQTEVPQQLQEAQLPDQSSINAEQQIISLTENRNDQDINQSEAEVKSRVGKKCYNVKCQSTKNLRKLKSRAVKARYRNFCSPCYELYIRNQFCEFCQQVYDDNQGDNNNWMGCDVCDRWNHVSCEFKNRMKNAYVIKQQTKKYLCIQCTDTKKEKTQSKKPKAVFNDEDVYQYQKPKGNKKTARQLRNEQNNAQYYNCNPNFMNIFNRPKQITIHLQSFLNSINNGYKHFLSDSEIKDDFMFLRSSIESSKLEFNQKKR